MAAQLVTCFLDPQPGEYVLDACAGRGGKTGHIAQMMEKEFIQERHRVIILKIVLVCYLNVSERPRPQSKIWILFLMQRVQD